MADTNQLIVDEGKVKNCVQSGIPLTVTTYTLPHDVEIYITKLLASFLKYSGHENLRDYLQYCVQELAVNAKKANTKRIYFQEHKADVNDTDSYEEVMKNFKKDTLGNIEHYLKLLRDNEYYIKVVFLRKNNDIIIEIRNNAVISQVELLRVYEKLDRAQEYNNMQDAFAQVLDDSEGAGLGIVVMVLMFKKMGLSKDCLDISPSDNETIARITIPLDKTKIVNISALTDAIVKSVNSLPQFPENILAVQKLTSDPNSTMGEIARQISVDPAMTADILRLMNSPLYITREKVDTIAEAVSMLGIKGVSNLLYSYGTQKVLGDNTKEKKQLWDHSYKSAFYAYNIAKNFAREKTMVDDSYVSGMLHDMGKIVFSDVASDIIGKMSKYCDTKTIPQVVFEDVTAGMNHAEIGAEIAEKWNFPASLAAAIRFHHDPLSAPAEYHPLVFSVYLANMICEMERGNVQFDQIESKVLKSFGLASQSQFESVVKRLNLAFNKK